MSDRHQRGRIRRQRRSFTLVEVLLALSVTALVSLSAAALVTATSYGTTSRRAMRDLLVKGQAIDARLSATIRSSLEAEWGTDSGSTYLVLWAVDTNDDDAKDNNEMQLIERDTVNDTLLSYRDESAAGTFADAATFRTQALASYPSETWATSVTALSLAVDATSPNKTLVSYRITIEAEDASETLIGAVALR